MSKTLVAELPAMTSADLARFEAEGGIWGKQRSIRRQQVNTMFVTTAAVSAAGFGMIKRRNTWYVVAGCLPVFALFGLVSGHAVGTTLFPSVADNKETTLMRYTWWAKECAKNWDMSQVNGEVWRAEHPHSKLFEKEQPPPPPRKPWPGRNFTCSVV